MYDIIPDIHGQSAKLRARLTALGYVERGGAYRHPDPARSVVFLGDFIDRGPDNAGVIGIVRAIVDAGTARAVMGNHELNAIQYATDDPDTGDGLRPRTAKNTRQHETFLAEFALGSAAAAEAVAWMRTLPLFLDLGDLRAVHACWSDDRIAALSRLTRDGVLGEDDIFRTVAPGDPLKDLVDDTLKGPETPLPDGTGFRDKDGTWRDRVRIAWWNRDPGTWQAFSISVDDPEGLPDGAPPDHLRPDGYAETAPPVFFGHYWLSGPPVLQAPNALCLDYSAGRDGPLLSYLMAPGETALRLDRIGGAEGSPRGA
ncbi:metallophosphoesterase [Rhodobacterales bacterium HKCCE2091]|nr:metallophosphoesterase [Rhodobacterales bacterium HKCCE2091]